MNQLATADTLAGSELLMYWQDSKTVQTTLDITKDYIIGKFYYKTIYVDSAKIRNNTEFKSHHPPSKLEASGGIDLTNVKEFAAAGVDIISIGELTDSVKSVDVSLDVL